MPQCLDARNTWTRRRPRRNAGLLGLSNVVARVVSRMLWLATFTWVAACRPDAGTTTPPQLPRERPAPREDDTAAPVADDTGETWLLRGARVMTATGVIYEKGDVLVRGRRIAEVGASITVDSNVRVVDATGKTVTPGLVDTHSHIGVYGAPSFGAHSDGNEVVAPVTAHVRAQDGYWPQDPTIDRARAGGVTTMQILPGSANLIGGRSVTVKTYPGALGVEQARFRGAPDGLKMACGENPKRVYADKGGPGTRMGNVAGYRNAFIKAQEYQRGQASYRDKVARYEAKQRRPRRSDDEGKDGKDDGPPDPPARDLGLETLAGALRGEILVHNHCYRADEMLGMLGVAEEFGFKIRSFHHAVEAYKIAPELAKAGTAASVWADWWGFKAEAFDGVRENAAMLSAAGARAIIHSDSGIGIQHLNQEASKAAWAGRRVGLEVSDDEALRWITINPAWALGVHDRIGTIEAGKHADLVVWDGDPFSVYSKATAVFIEGKLVYDRDKPDATFETDFEIGFDSGDGMGESSKRGSVGGGK